ncbi:TetR family transcriptional regulator [Actinocatenispora thailandica]|uniref:TetR family transcriptional regulator n=1 Tax=Actinocatenispora thailandica TaxID=227318 RepID=A0A7R7HV47_9ACTN|nr:TetR/AcrR family transcriptional regulator [Actinocatenispora thailandica]BCJ33348.1 TetR family transcriptional regulator [Actinocatenispora thailandica]
MRKTLTRTDWADAALTALADGGLAAVAVEPIATKLGATKGSFYWHFANRGALIDAALAHWADQHTEAVIQELGPITDPQRRLDALLAKTIGQTTANRAELALLAHADHPAVAPVVAAVTERRVEFIAAAYRQAGCPETEARFRAVLGYTAYIGLIQAQRATAGALLPDADRPAYLDFLHRTLHRDDT